MQLYALIFLASAGAEDAVFPLVVAREGQKCPLTSSVIINGNPYIMLLPLLRIIPENVS